MITLTPRTHSSLPQPGSLKSTPQHTTTHHQHIITRNSMLQHRALDCPAVEEARRAMVSAGYVLPPQCQPVPLEPRRRPPPVAATTSSSSAGGRRHSISCSPVRGVLPASAAAAVAAASADAQRLGQKRRFSLPYNNCGSGLDAGVPLTAFLPSEFKRRRTSTAPSSPRPAAEPGLFVLLSTETPTLPSIGELVGNHPEPCLPPHTAATPDHPHFSPSLAAPVPLDQQQQQTVVMASHPVMMTMDHPSTALYSNPTSSTIMSTTSSSSSTPTSSAPSSPRVQRFESAADQQLARDEAHAEKARRAERVAEILELMDRQNNGTAATDAQTTALGDAEHDGSWPVAGDVKRRRVGKDQTGILDLMFKVEPMPTQVTKKRLADGLGMTYKQVQIWFQNKRARCKRAVEAPPRSSHTFHNVLVSSDGRFMIKELAKARQQSQQQSPSHQLYDHQLHRHHEPSAAPPPVALRSCILTQ